MSHELLRNIISMPTRMLYKKDIPYSISAIVDDLSCVSPVYQWYMIGTTLELGKDGSQWQK